GHPLTGQASPSRSALCQYVMISPQLTPGIQRWLEAEETPSRGFRRRVNTTSVTMIKAMVRQSDAVTLIHPDEVRVELARGDFVPLAFGAPTGRSLPRVWPLPARCSRRSGSTPSRRSADRRWEEGRNLDIGGEFPRAIDQPERGQEACPEEQKTGHRSRGRRIAAIRDPRGPTR